ncbi:MAG: tryptophan--tRNA ligase [Spirochaetes bacterium]|nr:tryptophan--tRNA ligase [Spirochaetota bacterium]
MENKIFSRVLTGDRPTGQLHIGHYFGALKQRVSLQGSHETYVIIADVQVLTDNFQFPEKVRSNVYEVALDNLAVGIDPERSVMFIQSMIPEIAELTVFFSNLVTIARLERNPTVKEEFAQKETVFGKNITFGFLGYPVSQAADILAFEAAIVPVGEDQLPQIEQTREIVRKFNGIYGETFIEPEPVLSSSPRIKGLDGRAKMGKSIDNAIYLADNHETTERKIMNAVTDVNKIRKNDPGNPAVCVVFEYHLLFENGHAEHIRSECCSGTRGCVVCKKELAALVNGALLPIRERRIHFSEHISDVQNILHEGTEKARLTASATMEKVRERMHIDYRRTEVRS